MKKVLSIFLMLLMVCSFVVAEETDEGVEEATDEEVEEVEGEAIDEETEEETELISESNFGAKVRLLQLEKAVTKSYLIGSEVISVLSDKGEDVSELESILAEIEVLKDEVKALDPASESAVEDFVNIKRDIRDLNKQFKRIAAPLLSSDDKQAIREAIKDNEELASLNQDIRDVLLELNADRVGKALGRMGASDEELIEKIKSREATRAEVKEALKNAYSDLTPEQKKLARRRIKSVVNERKEVRQNVAKRVKAKHLTVRKERLQDRLKKVTVKKELARKRINQKIRSLDKVENRIKRVSVNVDKKERIQAKVASERGEEE